MIKGRMWWEWLFYAIIILMAVGSFYDYWILGKRAPGAGDICGPNHHWRYVYGGGDAELSCQEDR